MSDPTRNRTERKQVARAVLDRFGRSYADEAGISLKNQPASLFQLLCFALLSSARIRADIAASATRALLDEGWTTPVKMATSTWERRAKVLNRAGYARYDERTATMLADSTELLLDRWHGDLRRLRDEADEDSDTERRLLQEFKGIGPTGADIFAREVQVVWPECYPTADKRALQAADRLGLGKNPEALTDLVDRRHYPRLVDALVRVNLDKAYEKVA
jgi:transposase